jgi:hypothetical protein
VVRRDEMYTAGRITGAAQSIGLAGTGEVYAEWLAEISGSEVRDRMTKSIEILTESLFRRLRGRGRLMFYKNNVRPHLL